MKYVLTTVLFLFISSSLTSQTINLEMVASGFSSPVDIVNMGDERLFIVERRGYVKIIDENGNTLDDPFLDIDDIVFNSGGQDERGLLGLDFHPDYTTNGYFFVHYTDNSSNSVIARFEVDPDNPNLANPESREVILEIDQPAGNHNGGCVKFGPDGYLYIGMGDGGGANDVFDNGLNNQTFHAKMLRIDVDNGLPYTIPADNPFADNDEILDEIWALGMRNPWRFSFDKVTGDLWIGDVGQGALEEIDFQPADSPGGEHYGWSCYEGTEFTNLQPSSDCQGTYTEPVFEVEHQGFSGPCSITGGYVYRGSTYLDLIGKYFCADYCTGEFFVVEQDEEGNFSGAQIAQFNNDVSTFGEDSDGELYIAALSSGRIFKIMGEVTTTTEVIPSVTAISVSPNPTSNVSLLSIITEKPVTLSINLIDISGKEIFSFEKEIDGPFTKQIDMSKLARGTYILNINNNAGLVTKRIVKH